ncbi:transcription initiation factor IIF subunit beta [[Candida] railenensis]|uniref:Transcription initiation factor IIF subunit beta n=1 Tax=[Candida] railenensis TaxID=45579 RepID=A0A9P0W031_9ASCO|nr:transcription initiation factor IIF subunit beta [[Candida] railenensis]
MSSVKTSPVKKGNTPVPADEGKTKIKQDPGVASNGSEGVEGGNEEDPDYSILSDPEDYLEENESLDMNLQNGSQKIWLVKLPRYLAEKWSNIDQIGGQQLGRVKIKQGTGANRKLQVKLVLDQQDQSIPQEYDISVLNTQVRNNYVFSEENLKKFKQELTEMVEMPEQPHLQPIDKKKAADQASAAAAMAASTANGQGANVTGAKKKYKFYRVQKNKVGKDGAAGPPPKKFIPFVKTIPKKTALVGKICHDCQIIPSKQDNKYSEILSKRNRIQPEKARPKVTLLEEIPGVIQSNAGPSIRGNNTSVFLRSSAAKAGAGGIGGKSGEGRAIRMPKKDLLDLLFRLFEEYEYWSMKGLKERTRQPESYLKESLESIANLIKKGPYTSKYNLKPEYKRLRDAERAARLGLVTNDDENKSGDDDDDEDDDIEMEDVI